MKICTLRLLALLILGSLCSDALAGKAPTAAVDVRAVTGLDLYSPAPSGTGITTPSPTTLVSSSQSVASLGLWPSIFIANPVYAVAELTYPPLVDDTSYVTGSSTSAH